MTGFYRRRVRAVDESQYRRKDEKRFYSERVPDPAAEKGDEDAYQVVYRNAGGDRGACLFGRIGEVFDVDVGSHRGERYHRIEKIVHTADDEGDIFREDVVCESVEKADYDEDQSVRYHHNLVAEAVDYPADERRCRETANCGDREKKADYHRVGAVEKNEDIRTESEENLLSCAVKNFDHVVFRKFAAEVETPFRLVSLAASRHAKRKYESKKKYHAAHDENGLEKSRGFAGKKSYRENYDITRKHSHLMHRVLHPEGDPAASVFGIFESERIPHSELDVLAQRVDEHR